MRRIKRFPVSGGNSLHGWYRRVGFFRVVYNFLLIVLARYLPSLRVKNFLYRMVGIRVERGVSVGLMAMMDVFYPQYISIGENSVIGYNVTLLAHEFLVHEYRLGPVEIGKDVMIGANSTVLPGVRIGDGAVVGAGSLVNRDVPPGALVCGVPARVKSKNSEYRIQELRNER
ncbi:acyltransferase [Desulfoscipio geothermicus]|uniref:Hexapeptide repeat of succinyl-transferase n=1 Tax=Desulfoscipio geothermicus DSM 3669 TaxID=1121426 RepID=A0A1I6DDD7_9FIRM|nr:acyltransferase [Desulfoscipio geothermicus]SFR03407.1 Hexapeptide repeat of succinyl-transferase [Desulfoscipio geothermicus DSM 3669]